MEFSIIYKFCTYLFQHIWLHIFKFQVPLIYYFIIFLFDFYWCGQNGLVNPNELKVSFNMHQPRGQSDFIFISYSFSLLPQVILKQKGVSFKPRFLLLNNSCNTALFVMHYMWRIICVPLKVLLLTLYI